VGGLKVDELVNRLRKETGQSDYGDIIENSEYLSSTPPPWFNESKLSTRYDATPIINSGNSPMNEILKLAHNLREEEIMELRSPFVPAPVIDMLKSKDFMVFSVQKGAETLTYIKPVDRVKIS
jgi:hypothetical protein